MERKTRVTVGLNCIAKNRAVEVWRDIEIRASDDPTAIARRTLSYWYREREGELEPLVKSGSGYLVPDEVVISTASGGILARWTIVEEFNARFASAAR